MRPLSDVIISFVIVIAAVAGLMTTVFLFAVQYPRHHGTQGRTTVDHQQAAPRTKDTHQ